MTCSAQSFYGRLVCERCALAWDRDDTAPVCRPLTLNRMREALARVATDIEASQAALTTRADGTPPLRPFAHQGELERAQLLRACLRLIDRCEADPAIRDRLKPKKSEPEKEKALPENAPDRDDRRADGEDEDAAE